jgi:excisionase family DNA binding protein
MSRRRNVDIWLGEGFIKRSKRAYMSFMNDRTMSPGQLATIVGVSESTLKRWVDAGLLRAQKTAGGHRRIALVDALAFLRTQGRPAPSLEALGVLSAQAAAPPGEGTTPDTLASLLLGEDAAVARALLLEEFRRGRPLEDILDRLLGPAMVQIGALWAAGTIDVYQEHLATQRAWWILAEVRGLLPTPPAEALLALGGTPEGDPSLLPSLMAELTLAEAGWRAVNLGPDTPVASLCRAVESYRPRLIWISLTSHGVPPRFEQEYPRLRQAARAVGAAVMVGGQGTTAELQDRLVASAFGTRLAHLKAFARDLGSGARSGP